MVEITITGAAEAIAKIERVINIEKLATPYLAQAAAHVEKVASKYPPPRAGSKYVRTGYLGASWLSGANNGVGYVRNVGPHYNIYVQRAAEQMGYHRETGWKTDADIRASEEATVARMIAAAIKRGF